HLNVLGAIAKGLLYPDVEMIRARSANRTIGAIAPSRAELNAQQRNCVAILQAFLRGIAWIPRCLDAQQRRIRRMYEPGRSSAQCRPGIAACLDAAQHD